MADQSLSAYAETTVIEDTDACPVKKDSSDKQWRVITGKSIKDLALDSLTVGGTGTFNSLSVGGASTVASLKSQASPPGNAAIELSDDEADSITFDGDAQGIFVICGFSINAGQAIAFFRVGTSANMSILASNIAAGSIVATTGVLDGTTGADGNLTISAHTDNRIYIENRTGGGARGWQVCFLASQGADVSSL